MIPTIKKENWMKAKKNTAPTKKNDNKLLGQINQERLIIRSQLNDLISVVRIRK
jgi:hypothetical protein